MQVEAIDVGRVERRPLRLDADNLAGLASAGRWLGDLGACALAVGVATTASPPEPLRALGSIALMLAGLGAAGAYAPRRCGHVTEEFRRVALGIAIPTILCAALLGIATTSSVLTLGGVALGGCTAARSLIRLAVRSAHAAGLGVRRVVVVGRGPAVDLVASRLAKTHGTRVVGSVGGISHGTRALGDFHELGPAVESVHAHSVFIVPGGLETDEIETVLAELDRLDIDVKIVPGLPRLHHARAHVAAVGDLSVLTVDRPGLSVWQRTVKRSLDVVLSSLALLALTPLFIVIAIAIAIEDGFPVGLRQQRVGVNGRLFSIYKFRTMVRNAEDLRPQLANDLDGLIFKVRNDPRITRVGKVIRRFSIDEFPQFLNILKGDMSIVGPRPSLPDEVRRYDRTLARRLNVKPGATGIWQINGRNDAPFEDYVRFDLTYVESWSVGLDISIMLKTIPVLLTGRGAY